MRDKWTALEGPLSGLISGPLNVNHSQGLEISVWGVGFVRHMAE